MAPTSITVSLTLASFRLHTKSIRAVLTVQGLATVRAFRQQAAFLATSRHLVNESTRAFWPIVCCNRCGCRNLGYSLGRSHAVQDAGRATMASLQGFRRTKATASLVIRISTFQSPSYALMLSEVVSTPLHGCVGGHLVSVLSLLAPGWQVAADPAGAHRHRRHAQHRPRRRAAALARRPRQDCLTPRSAAYLLVLKGDPRWSKCLSGAAVAANALPRARVLINPRAQWNQRVKV